MKNNLKINIGYQTVYQFIITLIPLLTAPYLARVLGANCQGVYSYTFSIVNIFVLFSMLGIVNHGTRSIADSSDINEKNKIFSATHLIQVATTSISLIIYIVYLFFNKSSFLISLIQLLFIISCYFDIGWYFMGNEDFKSIISISSFFRILSVLLIFLLVKSKDDLWIYTLITVCVPLFSNIILYTINLKNVKYVSIDKKYILSNFKAICILFVPLLAMSIYHIMDKTMLGILGSYEDVGFYYNADKIINIPFSVISGIATVLFSRSSSLSKKDEVGFNKLFSDGMQVSLIIASALCFGICSVSKNFIPLFLGEEYSSCYLLINLLAPVMLIKSISLIIRYQYLIPKKKDSQFIISVCIGAFTNLILNILLIPKFGALGAVIATLVAEFVSCIIQVIFIMRVVPIFKILFQSFIYIFAGILMFVLIYFIDSFISFNIILKLLIEVLIGSIYYLVFLLIYWIISKNIFLDHFKSLLSSLIKK